MKNIIPFLLLLLIIAACEKVPQQPQQPKETRYSGTIEYQLPTIHQTTVCSRRFDADSIRWWDAPSVIIPYDLFGINSYTIVNATIPSTPNCIDSAFLIHNGVGYIIGDSLFESGSVDYIRYIGIVKIIEQGTWKAKFKKQP